MSNVVIFGNRLWAELLCYQIQHETPFRVVGFTVDQKYIRDATLQGLPVVPFEEVEKTFPPETHRMFVALSFHDMNKLRAQKYEESRQKGYRFISYVSATVTTWPNFRTGDNCLIHENTVVHPFVEIGNNVVIGPGAIIGHHSKIGDHVFIAPGAVLLGAVTVEEYSFIGANATIKEKVRIARGSMISTGVSITRNTKEKGVYVGASPTLLPKSSDALKNLLTFSWPGESKR